MRTALFLACLALAACEDRAWNTLVAEDPGVRLAMLQSIRIGEWTESEVATRWGKPTQIVYRGGQTEWIYRDMITGFGLPPQFGDSSEYVIVQFQYGVVTGVRTSDLEGCRATFPPRPPGPQYPNPSTVRPVNCGTSAPMGALASGPAAVNRPRVPADVYVGGKLK